MAKFEVFHQDILPLCLSLEAREEEIRVATLCGSDATFRITRYELVIDERYLIQWTKVDSCGHNLGIGSIMRLHHMLHHNGLA